MKKIVSIIVLFLILTSCAVKKKPIFVKVDDIKLSKLALDTLKLTAKAYFKSENDIGGKIYTDDLKVFVNGKEIAQVLSNEFKVPARKTFNFPITVAIPTKKLLSNDKEGFLGGLLKTVFKEKKILVKLQGDLTYRVLGFSKKYPINKTKEISLKK